jgi:hypothetical protein
MFAHEGRLKTLSISWLTLLKAKLLAFHQHTRPRQLVSTLTGARVIKGIDRAASRGFRTEAVDES